MRNPAHVLESPFAARPLRAVEDPRTRFRLDYVNNDRAIKQIRMLVHSYVQLSVEDRLLAGRVTIAAAHLAEEAAQRCPEGRCSLSLSLSPAARSALLELTTEVDDAQATALQRALDNVNGRAPADACVEALAATDDGAETRLCLARVRYEGQMELSMRREGTHAVIVAQTR